MKDPQKIDPAEDFTKPDAYQRTMISAVDVDQWMAVMTAGNDAFLCHDIQVARKKFEQAAELAEGMIVYALTYDLDPGQAVICLKQSYANSSELCFRTGQVAEGVAVLHARLDRLGYYALSPNLQPCHRADLLSQLNLALEDLTETMAHLGSRPDDINAIRQVVATLHKQGMQLMATDAP